VRGKKVSSTGPRELYGVETRALNQAVTRNIGFPRDSLFTSPGGSKRFKITKLIISEENINILREPSRTRHPHAVRRSQERDGYSSETSNHAHLHEDARDDAGYGELIKRIQRIEKRQDVESREIWKASSSCKVRNEVSKKQEQKEKDETGFVSPVPVEEVARCTQPEQPEPGSYQGKRQNMGILACKNQKGSPLGATGQGR